MNVGAETSAGAAFEVTPSAGKVDFGGGPGGLPPLAVNVEPIFMLDTSPCANGCGCAGLLLGTPAFDALTCIAQALSPGPDGDGVLDTASWAAQELLPGPPGAPPFDTGTAPAFQGAP